MRGAMPLFVMILLTSSQDPVKPSSAAPPAGIQKVWSDSNVDATGSLHLAAGNSALFLTNSVAGITARAKTDGKVMWKVDLPSAAPAVPAAGVVAVLSESSIDVLDQATGTPRWRVELAREFQRPRLWSLPLPERRALYTVRDRFVLISGKQLKSWRHGGTPDWGVVLDGRPTTPIVEQSGALLVGTDAPSLVALDTDNGTVRWQTPLAVAPSFVSAAEDQVYVTGATGGLYCFEPGASSAGRPFRVVPGAGPPLRSGERVYLALMDNSIREFDRECGTQRWSRQLPSRPEFGPIVNGDRLMVVLISGELFEVVRATGERKTGADKPVSGDRLQAVAVDATESVVFTVIGSEQTERTLSAWRSAVNLP